MDFLFFNFVPTPQQYDTKDSYGFFFFSPEDGYGLIPPMCDIVVTQRKRVKFQQVLKVLVNLKIIHYLGIPYKAIYNLTKF
jgi:hypothetical protein